MVIKRIEKEMNELGFDEVKIDGMATSLAIWARRDYCRLRRAQRYSRVGEISNWKFDPYKGYENETENRGRGASDQLGGIVSYVYGLRS